MPELINIHVPHLLVPIFYNHCCNSYFYILLLIYFSETMGLLDQDIFIFLNV